jgi:hypothetical protein
MKSYKQMFALILLTSVQGLTAFMLPNAVPNTRHACMDAHTHTHTHTHTSE